jgi:hypothetical protein
MPFSISVFKDAAEAIDKLVDAISKLGTMFTSAAKAGVAVFDFATARSLIGALRCFDTGAIALYQTQQLKLRPKLQEFIKSPTDTSWMIACSEIRTTRTLVDQVSKGLKKISPSLVTEEFYPILAGTLMAREVALDALIESPMPKTPEEIEAVKELLAKYDVLIAQLEKACESLSAYIKSLIDSGKWPADAMKAPPRARGQF